MINNKSKKQLLAIGALILSSLLIAGCQSLTYTQIDSSTNIAQILSKTTEIQQQYDRGEITLNELKSLTSELEKKYKEITLNDIPIEMQKNISSNFEKINLTLNGKQKLSLPARATNLGLTEPTGLNFVSTESKQTTLSDQGYDSITLVYTGDYIASKYQAGEIAANAKIGVSPEFQAVIDAMSGQADARELKSMVYSNHGLLDTNIDYLITVSSDENGKLTIEAINYKQMENR